MELNILINGIYEENCYIISSNGRAVIIDPGVDCGAITGFLDSRELTAEAVLITHSHFDHCQCAGELARKTNAKIYISKADYVLAQMTEKIPPFGAVFYEDDEGKNLQFAGKKFKIIPTPGHTEGGVCIEYDGVLFTGDTLFYGAIGRTDLPTGNLAKLKQSLKMLSKMYDDIEVFAGHGPSTFLSQERSFIERF